ncbi:Centrosomal protein of 19 kDa [Sparganum proliferum]
MGLVSPVAGPAVGRRTYARQGFVDLINGRSLEESLKINAALESISSDEDLNKADDETLERKKLVMEETFERNRVRPTDPDFEYDIAVDFPKQVETSGWDSDFSDF